MPKAKSEKYGNVYEEYAANAELPKREKNANPNLNNKKLIMKKWCILFVVLSLSIGALVGSLSMYFMQQNDATTTTASTTTITTTAPTTSTTSITTTTSTTTRTTSTTSITTPGSRLLIYSDAVIERLKFNDVLYGRPNGGK